MTTTTTTRRRGGAVKNKISCLFHARSFRFRPCFLAFLTSFFSASDLFVYPFPHFHIDRRECLCSVARAAPSGFCFISLWTAHSPPHGQWKSLATKHRIRSAMMTMMIMRRRRMIMRRRNRRNRKRKRKRRMRMRRMARSPNGHETRLLWWCLCFSLLCFSFFYPSHYQLLEYCLRHGTLCLFLYQSFSFFPALLFSFILHLLHSCSQTCMEYLFLLC